MRRRAVLLVLGCALLWPALVRAHDVRLDGPLIQGALIRGSAPPGTRVWLDGRAVRVAEDGRFLLGLGRDAPKRMRLELAYPDGTRERRALEIAQRDYEIQRIDGLPPEKVTPPPEVLERIAREAELVAAAREVDRPEPWFESGFAWPVTGEITGVFGSQRILNGAPRQPHFGVDVAAPAGTPVKAPADGVVALVHPDMYFSGGTLVLDHGHGLTSAYLHLKEIRVAEGERVRRGQAIASVGATGRVTGAHLDWRFNWFDQRLDPVLVAGPMPEGP